MKEIQLSKDHQQQQPKRLLDKKTASTGTQIRKEEKKSVNLSRTSSTINPNAILTKKKEKKEKKMIRSLWKKRTKERREKKTRKCINRNKISLICRRISYKLGIKVFK